MALSQSQSSTITPAAGVFFDIATQLKLFEPSLLTYQGPGVAPSARFLIDSNSGFTFHPRVSARGYRKGSARIDLDIIDLQILVDDQVVSL